MGKLYFLAISIVFFSNSSSRTVIIYITDIPNYFDQSSFTLTFFVLTLSLCKESIKMSVVFSSILYKKTCFIIIPKI